MPDYIETNVTMRHEHVKMQKLLRDSVSHLWRLSDLCDGLPEVEELISEINRVLDNTYITLHDFGVPKDE